MRLKKSEWQNHIKNCINSGRSQKEYSKKNNLNLNTFKYWWYRLKKEKMDLNHSGFIEIPYKKLNHNSEIIITLSNGIQMKVDSDIKPETVKILTSALKELK
jgi:hypothetical protein